MALKLKIQKIHEEAVIPFFAHEGDAALDLFSVQKITLEPGERWAIPTGIAMEIPKGYVGLVWDKSGLSMNHGLKTLGGVIDATYRGEVMVGMINLGSKAYTFEKGNKVAQMIIQKREGVIIKEIKKLTETKRGKGGFGSTGL
ncbi:MAG: dUTP diphosphatase [Candidatus Paceibacterota bacterium]|jgi:dUTP pyrophosphatase